MLKELNPYNWPKNVKDWLFRIMEALLTGAVIMGCYIAYRIFTWEREITWKAPGKIAEAEVLGNFGDFAAGTIGVLLGFASMYLMFRTLKSQRGADARNAYLMKSQQFSSIFFELLNLYHKQVESLKVWVDNNEDVWDGSAGTPPANYNCYSGKELFTYYMQKLHRDFNPSGSYGNNQKRAVKEYQKIYGRHSFYLSAYFRTIYRIFELIDRSDLEEKDKYNYLKIMRAQFTRGELFFLHYNALTYPGDATKYYITRYRLTKHLNVLDFLEFKDVYEKLPDQNPSRINGLNCVLYHLWKDLYNIGRGKTKVDHVNKEWDTLSTKYKFRISVDMEKSVEIKLLILSNTRNMSEELKSLQGMSPEFIRNILNNLLKCVLVHSSFQMLNTSKQTRFSCPNIIRTPRMTTIKVKAFTRDNTPLRISCFDIKPQRISRLKVNIREYYNSKIKEILFAG